MQAGHLVAGEWRTSEADATSQNPAHPDETVLQYGKATTATVDDAVAAAREVFPSWRATPAPVRGGILRQAAITIERDAAELAELLTREEGKPLPEALGEVRRAAAILHYHAAQAWQPNGQLFASSNPNEEIRTLRVPLGVVGAITPWNFPIAIPAWKIAPALVHGNTVVWKPASDTPAIAVAFARHLEDAGIPKGVLNLVLGPGAIGQHLVDHEQIDAITFTGSGAIGHGIWKTATPRGVKVQMELGGHSPALVYPDADLDRATAQIITGAMGSTGQKCTATRRVIAHRAIADELTERLAAAAGRLRIGDGLLAGIDVGPLVSRGAQAEVATEVEAAIAAGATAVAGGSSPVDSGLDGGYYFAPTVLTNVQAGDRIAQEEVFGPVVSVLSAGDDDEMLAVANSTRFGLAGTVFTRDERTIRRVLTELDVGLVHVNNATTGGEPHVPFGGLRDSSAQGPREQGLAAVDFFTETKTAYIEPGTPNPEA